MFKPDFPLTSPRLSWILSKSVRRTFEGCHSKPDFTNTHLRHLPWNTPHQFASPTSNIHISPMKINSSLPFFRDQAFFIERFRFISKLKYIHRLILLADFESYCFGKYEYLRHSTFHPRLEATHSHSPFSFAVQLSRLKPQSLLQKSQIHLLNQQVP